MLSQFKNQRGVAEFALLTVVSVVAWLLTLGVANNLKKERQPQTVQAQQDQDQAKQQ